MYKDKNFIWGVAFGICLILALYIFLNGSRILLSYVGGEINPEQKSREIIKLIENNFVDDVDKDKINDGIYSGIVQSLNDKYSYYMNEESFTDFMEMTEGSYKGVGIIVNFDSNTKSMKVLYVYDDSPAAKYDIKKDDLIKKVNDLDVNKENYSEILKIIKNAKEVKISLLRPSTAKSMDILIKPDKIDLPTVSSKMLDDEIGYISISSFDKITEKQFEENFNYLTNSGMQRLIIDLRDNPGGLLTTVCKITDKFIPQGTITYLEYKNGKREYHNSDDKFMNKPLVILVNENSASASEVLTGAIKDTNSGKIVGTRTYGKGVVQSMYRFSDNSGIKLTVAKYYTPNGICIDGTGIEPDYEQTMPENAKKLTEDDLQLKKAIEIVKQFN